jgi:putative salt-induced outer membrane protein YdiY
MRLLRAFSFAYAILVLLFIIPLATHAESVTLSNGDRITGDISDSDGKTLTLKTSYAGDVKIQWSAIKELIATKPLYVTTDDKKTISGTVVPNGKNLTVHTVAGATVDLPLAKIAAVRSSVGEDAYEKSLHPNWDQDWKGNATIGLALARGNSDTTNFNTALHLDRKTNNDEITAYASSVYATNGLPGGGVTADAILGGARYEHNITPKFFAFGAGDFTHDELQGLNIRGIYTGGFGWHVIDKPNKTTFDLLGGANYTQESYSGTATEPSPNINRNLPGLTFGDDFMHKFGASTTVTETAYFYPDLDDINQYRFSLDAAVTTKINKWFGWQSSISDRYVTNPPIPGTKSNDVIPSTGLNVAFGK